MLIQNENFVVTEADLILDFILDLILELNPAYSHRP